jgi:hypothetical protein
MRSADEIAEMPASVSMLLLSDTTKRMSMFARNIVYLLGLCFASSHG